MAQPSPFAKKNPEASKPKNVVPCPKCGDSVLTLRRVEAGLRLSLQKEGFNEFPHEVCEKCYRELERAVSKGAKLRAEQLAKDQQRLYLWKNRTELIKQARELMRQKIYVEAAIHYEKYLKILEVVYQAEPGKLTPDVFKGTPTELTIIASTYWDLLRIYDSNPKYGERQKDAANKLAEFVRYTPLTPEISKRALDLEKSAKNPAAYRLFLKQVDKISPRCFIATAAFSGQRTETVQVLCVFRDQFLRKSEVGRVCIRWYYLISPAIARRIDQMPASKPFLRFILKGVALFLRLSLNLNRGPQSSMF